MFIGKYYYKLQQNKRISLPKDFRVQAEQWVVTRGLDGCLFIFKASDFEKELHQLSNKSFTKKSQRDLVRIMTNEAKQISADDNGRVHLPKYLIEFAQLKEAIVIVGSFNRIEVWDQTQYHNYITQIEEQAETIAEQTND